MNAEYLIAMVVAAVLVGVIAVISLTLVALNCLVFVFIAALGASGRRGPTTCSLGAPGTCVVPGGMSMGMCRGKDSAHCQSESSELKHQ